ncbi:MAG: alpha/beta hydrolase [Promethearchaeota archaeon]|jgi:alpha-beta hydrolase superfamily lysophospholipase
MKNQTGYFEGRELTKLFYQCWLPDTGEIKAYIIGIHGWGTHSDRMMLPAEYLTGKGYAVYAFDLRGHYRNTGDTPGHIESIDHIHKDIVLFMVVVLNIAKEKKVFLMGHSFGGLMSLIYAINHPALSGVLLSSPLLGMFMKLSMGKKVIKSISKNIVKLAPNKILNNVIDQNQLTSDLKILRKHIADKNRIDVISAKSAAEIDKHTKWVMDNASKLICPVLIMQGGNDKIVDKVKSKQFYEKVKSKDKSYKEYDGFLHELWNEKGRAQVYQDMFIWLEKHLK